MTRYETLDFESEEDFLEWLGVTANIIKAFEHRGYALYKLGRAPMMFTEIEMIMEFVQDGRAEDALEISTYYLPLPLVKDSRDTFLVRKAFEEMIRQLRGPYFLDLIHKPDNTVEVLGKHLVDTIRVEPPFLHLIVDVKFGRGEENTIEIPLAEAPYRIAKQLMMSLRG